MLNVQNLGRDPRPCGVPLSTKRCLPASAALTGEWPVCSRGGRSSRKENMPQHGQQRPAGWIRLRVGLGSSPSRKGRLTVSPMCGNVPASWQWLFPYTTLWPNIKVQGALISMVNEISSQGVQKKNVESTNAAFWAFCRCPYLCSCRLWSEHRPHGGSQHEGELCGMDCCLWMSRGLCSLTDTGTRPSLPCPQLWPHRRPLSGPSL